MMFYCYLRYKISKRFQTFKRNICYTSHKIFVSYNNDKYVYLAYVRGVFFFKWMFLFETNTEGFEAKQIKI